ncbi:type II toxin-antitoxin system HicB family antitoxin [Peptoniphilus sp.]|uniref:type II toxin-antitoxin system HicB family antitoxin n=1 Tax=Peptoniphilus sp. TaxID=1971214 RepID=UPI0039917ED2
MDRNYIEFYAKCEWNKEDNCYYASVPGFDGVFTDGEDLKEIERNLIDIMTLAIIDFENENVDYVKLLDENSKNKNDKNLRVIFFLPYEKSKVKEVYKNKTLTIPTWLDDLAREKNLNFSSILQNALKKELNIKY